MNRRRSLHQHLMVVPFVAVLAVACQDDVTPTGVARSPSAGRRPSAIGGGGITVFSDVTYAILHGTVRIFNAEIKSVDGIALPAGQSGAAVPAGATLRLTGNWEIGPITNVDECQLCSYSAYLAWGSDMAVNGATPLNRGLVTLTSPALNPNVGASGTFDWTTHAPHVNGEVFIGAGQSIGAAFADDVGQSGPGRIPGDATLRYMSFRLSVRGPTISPAVVSGTLGNNGWYTSDVTVSWEVKELDGIEATGKTGCDPVTISSDETAKTLTCSVTSEIGTAVRSVTIKRDATKPTIAFNSVSPAANAAGWNKSDVTATWTCSDGGSGFVSASASQTISTEGTNQSATGSCVDKAGNMATDTRTGINLDKSPPTLSPFVSPNVVALKGSAVASPNANDALSGVAGLPSCGAVVTSLAGTFLIDCTATDKAGNTATERAIYTVTGYTFGGFLAPVDPAPTLNSAKAGSAIPVKFSLGGYQGLDILAAGYPKWQTATCSASASVDAIEETVTAADGTSLTYDAKTDQYKYVWKTAKAWGATCGDLILKLADGSEYSARFQFTK